MAKPRKVDLEKLHSLFNQGKTGREIAAEMGVGPAAISKNLKSLRHALSGDYPRVAAKVHNQQIINMGRLEGQASILDEQITNVRYEIEKAPVSEKNLSREVLVKLLAESRKQTLLKFTIEKSIYQMVESKQFQNDVLTKLREITHEKREEFFEWLDTQAIDDRFEADGSLRVSEAD